MSDEHYAIALSDLCSGYQALTPPKRVTVAEGAAENLVIKQPGQAGGPWSGSETPYMIEPMNTLASRLHEATAFVGPARTGKTAGLLLGWVSHTVRNDPGDTLFIQMSKDKAREFSKTDVDRAIRNSPRLVEMKSNRAIDSNTFDTMFRNGVWLRIAWPTVSNVSGSTYRYVAITDIDRIENAENVDGEGPLFDLARKRTTTFMSRGMCLAESSPGKDLETANWTPSTPHEGPPVGGIVGIYNRSDRRRWYWQCPDCSDHFEAAPGMGLFHLPPDKQLIEDVRTMNIGKIAAEYGSRIICPHCGSLINAKHKQHLNSGGIWLPDGARINSEREITGEPMVSTIAGFWLGGVAAAYQPWRSLIERYLQGLKDYALTGSEETLKTTINTDQGLPYTPRHLVESASTKSMVDKANTELQRYVVPAQTRSVAVSVDVQSGTNARFVVQVHAVGAYMEQWLVDRFEIRESKRPGMGADFAPIDPTSYPEDWDILTEKLLLATWRTPLEGREIKLSVLVVDTGGDQGGKGARKEDGGVAQNAYAWYRRVRARKDGLANKIVLYKGASNPSAPIIKETKVGKRGEKSKPDIPLLVCNPNLLSDQVDAGLKRDTPGPNFIHLPPVKDMVKNPDGWLPQAFTDELHAEVRQPNGVWKQIRKRNESFDLCRMIRAGLLRKGLDKIKDWNVVPAWLAPLEINSEVITVEGRREMKEAAAAEPVISEAPKVRVVGRPVRKARRSAPSPYLR
jgi:phage terminase large subunit GpA-like protein